MIEVEIKNFIDANLPYKAYTQKKNTSNPYYVIERVGGSKENHIDVATVAIQFYAPSDYQAIQGIEMLNDAMLYDFTLDSNIASVSLNSTYNFPDEETKQYRKQSVFEIFYYGGN